MKASSCDVIVVGGGITGAATAVHLAAAGVRAVTVVDAGAPGSGSTPADAGIVGISAERQARAGAAPMSAGVDNIHAEMHRYAIDYYSALSGVNDIGFRVTGTLWLARREAALREQRDLLRDHPLIPAAKELTAEEVHELWPLIRTDDVVGGMYDSNSAQIDAGRANRALVEAGRIAGIDFRWAAQVAQILHDGQKATGVMLTSGEVLRAPTIIVAVGAWTNALLEPLGRRIALVPQLATRITVPDLDVPADLPTLIVPELGDLWLREGAGGLSYGNAWGRSRWEPRPAPTRPDLGELASEMHTRVAGPLAELIPGLAERDWRWIQGVPCVTPDRRMYAGQIPGLEGVIATAGCNGNAVTYAPGIARALAGLVVGADVHDVLAPFALDRHTIEL